MRNCHRHLIIITHIHCCHLIYIHTGRLKIICKTNVLPLISATRTHKSIYLHRIVWNELDRGLVKLWPSFNCRTSGPRPSLSAIFNQNNTKFIAWIREDGTVWLSLLMSGNIFTNTSCCKQNEHDVIFLHKFTCIVHRVFGII